VPPRQGEGWIERGEPLALGLRLAAVLIGRMPRALRYRLADVGGSLFFGILPGHARQARSNYRVFAPGDRGVGASVARRAFRNYARTILDFLVLEKLLEEVKRTPGALSLAPLTEVLKAGRGAIVVTPHLGNWDLGAAAIATCGRPVHAVADPFGPPAVDELVRATRERLGVGVIPVGPVSARAALRALRRNEVLLLACDIDKGGAGVAVQFLGRQLVLPAGPASLALKTGAKLIPGYMRRRPDGRYESRLLDPLPDPRPAEPSAQVAELTQAIASSFEEMIRSEPSQWFAFHSLDAPADRAKPALQVVPPGEPMPRKELALPGEGKSSGPPQDGADPLLPYLGLRAAELALRAVDRSTAYRVTGPLAAVLTLCWPSHWSGLKANLAVVRPDLDRRAQRQLLRRNVRNFLKAWIDLLQMAHRPLQDWRDLITLEDLDHLQEARAAGRGVIIVSLHLGSWEAAIASVRDQFSETGGGLALLAEQVRPIRCFRWLVRARRKVGCQVIPLNVDAARLGDQEAVSRSGASAARQIYRVLSKEGAVVIAIDRDLLGTGKPLPFCGHRASIPLGAVEIAARTGSAILPVCLLREPHDTYSAKVFAPIQVHLGANPEEDLRQAARQLLRILEPELREHADQWTVLKPIFGEPMAELEAPVPPGAPVGASVP